MTVQMEPCEKRIRAYLGGELVADSTRTLMVWDVPYHPWYYFPHADVRAELVPDAALRPPDAAVGELEGFVTLSWDAMDGWFEEDEEVFVHPRNPYKRVDVAASSRHVTVSLGGVTVAESRQGRFVFETGVPRRIYLPKTDVRMDLLTPSDTLTFCPYKGEAIYWHLTLDGTTHDDLVWSYQWPVHESAALAGLVCFYPDRVETHVDGDRQQVPPEDVATMPSPRAGRAPA